MGADHHDLVGEVGARDLGDGVVGHLVVVVELGLDVDLQLDLLVVLQQAQDPVVVLGRHGDGGDADALAGLAGAGAVDAQDAVGAGADLNRGEDLLGLQELVERLLELAPLERALAELPQPTVIGHPERHQSG